MTDSMCSEVLVEATITPDGGIIGWIKDHPIESIFIIISGGAFTYIVYDSFKEKGYQPTKSKKASKR